MLQRTLMAEDGHLKVNALGGGRKGAFLLLRYLFIIAAGYLLVFQSAHALPKPEVAVMIAFALASNIVLSMLPGPFMLSWYVEAPVLIADTIWVSWALNTTGATGQEFFLLYFFVLFLATIGESLWMMILGSTAVSVANVWLSPEADFGSTQQLLRIAFFYAVALFYGNVLSQIRAERQRADRGYQWARVLEAKVSERTEELRRAYHESLAASRLKSELVANMSHELRTPLHIILGYGEILLDRQMAPAGEGHDQAVRRIRDSAKALLRLVDGVLDLGKLETGQMPVDYRQVPLDALMQEVQARERIPPAPGVSLKWQIAEQLPSIETDHGKLEVILDNLINNAIKFTSAGWISVSVADLPGDAKVEFRITDTGPGIAEESLPTIFEPFRQLEGTSDIAVGGVGLGLAIVQRYAALLGGEIEVGSKRGSGSTFTVRVPYGPPRIAQPLERLEQQVA